MDDRTTKSGSAQDDTASASHPQAFPPSPRKEDEISAAFTPAGAGVPFSWHVASAIGAAAGVAALYFGLEAGTAKSSWFHAFLFDRSFVQFITLYVFFLGVGLLVERSFLYLREVKAFRLPREQQMRGDWTSRVCRRFRRLKSVVDIRPAEAHEYGKQLAEADASDLEFGYHVVGELIQILPLLGFFGTVLGLSQGLHNDFFKETAQAAAGIKSFVGAIATAFDTTLLALACTIMLIILQLLIRKREELSLADLDRMADNFVARHCSPSANAGGQTDLSAQWRGQYSEHLRSLAADAAAAMRSEMSKIPAAMAGQFREELAAATTRILDQSAQQHQVAQDKLVSTAAASLSASVEAIIATIDRQAAAWGAINAPLKQALQEIREAVSALNNKDGEAARALAAALREQLEPFQQGLRALTQEQGRTAEIVSSTLRENTDRFCLRMGEILNRPRRVSFVERPEDQG